LLPARNLIVEPAGRGTAVAIAYGAAVIARRSGPGVVAVMPADHIIRPPAAFRATLRDAIAMASSYDSVVVIGVPPTYPEPGFGYQKIGAPIGRGFVVESFVEKPPTVRARAMVKSGKYLWNAGMFVVSHRALEAELKEHCPTLEAATRKFASMAVDKIAPAYRRLAFDSFDREIVEKSARVLGVKARFSWHDVGSWEGLREAMGGGDTSVLRGNVIALDSTRVLAHSDSRLMVLFGVNDIIAVDTNDAILITTRAQSQEVRRITEELARRKLHRHL